MSCNNKIAIGGIGGSGTRAVAELFMQMGYFMGHDLNVSNDNLLFTLLFKRKNILILPKKELHRYFDFFFNCSSDNYSISKDEKKWLHNLAENDNIQHDSKWLFDRVKICIENSVAYRGKFGWKEPNTHIIIDKFLEYSRDIKFIYVYRNGLDMAFSSNQNQLKFWGDIFLNEHKIEINPRNSLRYWCASHKRILAFQKIYPENIYMLDFDKMCVNTKEELNYLFDFLDIADRKDIDMYKKIFIQPSSINRYKNFSIDQFDKKDVAFLKLVYVQNSKK